MTQSLHFRLQVQIRFQPVAPGKYTFSSFNVLSADGHRRRQPVTLSLDLGNLHSIVTAAQTVVELPAGVPQFLYFSLFSAYKVRYIFRCGQLFPANQLRLTADTVQTAALLPQFRGERAAFASFGENT